MIGLQLVPQRPIARLRLGRRAARPGAARRRAGGRHHRRRRHRAERRACRPSSTSSSDASSDVPPPPPGRRLRARDALVVVGVVTLLLVLFQGQAVRNWGEQMDPGIGRDVVLAFGEPAGWIADRLPLADATDDVTGLDRLGGRPRRQRRLRRPHRDRRRRRRPTSRRSSPESFDPLALGEEPPKLELDKLLVTGDSLVHADGPRARAPARRRGRGRARSARRHGHLEAGRGGLGQALHPAGRRRGARRGGGVHRRQRRLPAPGRRAAGRSSAAARSGPRPTPTGCGG